MYHLLKSARIMKPNFRAWSKITHACEWVAWRIITLTCRDNIEQVARMGGGSPAPAGNTIGSRGDPWRQISCVLLYFPVTVYPRSLRQSWRNMKARLPFLSHRLRKRTFLTTRKRVKIYAPKLVYRQLFETVSLTLFQGIQTLYF